MLDKQYSLRAQEVGTKRITKARELRNAMSEYVPTDTEFEERFATARVSRPYLARYYLRALERAKKGISHPEYVENEEVADVDLEHVMALHPAEKQMQLRIGLHLGDIIIDGEDIYGDGVNIAARLEGIAEPGGIYISRQAFDQIEGKLPLTWRPLGPQTLKNIPKPVDVYSAELGSATAPTDPDQSVAEFVKL